MNLIYRLASLLLVSFVFSAGTFTTADPPMIYLHHFVSYDSTYFLLNNQKIHSPSTSNLSSRDKIDVTENIVVLDQLNPKVISAMVTSAIARYKQMKIAGESIQNRVSAVNVLELVKGSSYPKETDYVLIGELNVIGAGHNMVGSNDRGIFQGSGLQYEVDLKIIDVSTQDIISSKSISIPFSELNSIRKSIQASVDDIMVDILSPFTSAILVYADSTSVGMIDWGTLTLRPLKTLASGKVISTTNKDIELVKSTSFESLSYALPEYAREVGCNSNDYRILSSPFDRRMSSSFLQGDYVFRVQLVGYDKAEYFEKQISVVALQNRDFKVELTPPPPPPPLPPPPPPVLGDIAIQNLQNGLGFEIYQSLDSLNSTRIISGYCADNKIHDFHSDSIGGIISQQKYAVSYKDLPAGQYVVNAFGRAEEAFPGKHFVTIFSFSDTLVIEEKSNDLSISLPEISAKSGREIIIYFDPFPESIDEEYRLYVNKSSAPFTVISIVGELHIEGVSNDFDGLLRIERDGFSDAMVIVKPGNTKLYTMAKLSNPASRKKTSKEKVGFGSFLK
ncbi:MAG: hypothetical protein HOI42_12375 [Candidatus Marinimicrobia bacterium]|jgi:hypothetical protein|nr:hypothetical protein [Candidatus Neomarinimicrobiota bacterium]MBT6217542.1 hypothetical protein [Candidatus Neomarinimicrobiota bacterium]